MQKDCVFSCLDPRGDFIDIELTAPSKRIDEFTAKTIYFIDNGKQGSEFILKTILGLMEGAYPDAKLCNRYYKISG